MLAVVFKNRSSESDLYDGVIDYRIKSYTCHSEAHYAARLYRGSLFEPRDMMKPIAVAVGEVECPNHNFIENYNCSTHDYMDEVPELKDHEVK